MGDVSLSTLRGEPRRKIVTLTASDSAVAIPSWAQGGKGIVYVTGCGGGASGSVGNTSGQRGFGGGAGGFAVQHPMYISAAVSTLSATIGAGALGVTATTSTNGTAGGNTTVQVGSTILTLQGGLRPVVQNRGRGGRAFVGNSIVIDSNDVTTVLGVTSAGASILSGILSPASTLSIGADGGIGAGEGGGFGGGGHSMFGTGGASLTAGPTTSTNGGNATGYGAGGAGALTLSGVAATSGAGSPGILTLEFVEGF